MPTPKLTAGERIARFWTFVEKNGPIYPTLGTPCWLWTGYRMPSGYGNFMDYIEGRKDRLAHRYAYRTFVGPIPDGIFVLHRCDNPPCVRPDHLFLGTQADNLIDAVAKGRQSRGETHAATLRGKGRRLTREQVSRDS